MSYHLTPETIIDAGLRKGGYDLTLQDLKDNPHGIDLGPLQTRFPERLHTTNKKIKLVPELFPPDLDRLQETATTTNQLLLIGRRHLRSNNSWMHNVEITKDIMEGVVSIPHGWGHNRSDIQLSVAQAHPGVSANDLTDEYLIDKLSGNAAVNGVPVKV